jgi:hypothetical protein
LTTDETGIGRGVVIQGELGTFTPVR